MKWKDLLAQGMQNKQAKQAQHDGKGSRGDQHAAKKVNATAPGSGKRVDRGASRGK